MKLHQLLEAGSGTLYHVTSLADDDENSMTPEEYAVHLAKKTGLEFVYLRRPTHSGGWPEFLISGTLPQFKKFAKIQGLDWKTYCEYEGAPKTSKKEAVAHAVSDFERSTESSPEYMTMAGKSPLQKLAGGDSPEMQALQKKIADKLAKRNKE